MNELVKLTKIVKQSIEKSHDDSNFFSFINYRFSSNSQIDSSSVISILESEIFPQLVQLIQLPDALKKFDALKNLRKFVTLPDDQVPYKQIIDCQIINYVCVFLDSTVSPPFQFNSVWILQNILTKPEYYGNLPMNNIISQLVKLLNLTDEPSICTMCLFCLGNILKGSFLWIDAVLDTNIISVLISFDDKGDDLYYQKALLFFIQSFCFSVTYVSSYRYLLDMLPLIGWLLECNHGDIEQIIQEQALSLLRSICIYFETISQFELLLKQPIFKLVIQQLKHYSPNSLYIALDLLFEVTEYGIPEELEKVFKPLVPILMFIVRQYMKTFSLQNDDDSAELEECDISITHLQAMNILERMCRYNDVMIPVSFLAANVYKTISHFITNPVVSRDKVSSERALSIIVFSVLNADEQNLFYLCEENVMITLAWRLSLVSHYLHHNLKNGLMDVSSSRSLGRERPESYGLEDIVNHREWMDKLTEKVIDSIVENVICECEERDCLVEKFVGNMIDLFVDSKEGYREHSEEDDMIIEKVTNELVDGIVGVLCEPPPERQFVSEIEYTQPLQASITACELIILAMSRMIMKGQRMVEADFAHYNKYLRQLQTFADTPAILQTLIVPTSVVMVWNRISMVVKGCDYYDFDWDDVAGCMVNEPDVSLFKRDINHLLVTDSGQLISSYSFQDKQPNEYWIITMIEKDMDCFSEDDGLCSISEEKTCDVSLSLSLRRSSPNQTVSLSTEDDRLHSSFTVLPLSFGDDAMTSTEGTRSPRGSSLQDTSRFHRDNNSNPGFSKRFYSSYNPNAVIVGSRTNDYHTRRGTQRSSSDDVFSDGGTSLSQSIPCVSDSLFVCFHTDFYSSFRTFHRTNRNTVYIMTNPHEDEDDLTIQQAYYA